MYSVEILDPNSVDRWDDLVLETRSHSFFHSSFWAKVLAETYHYQPLYFTIRNNGRINGLLPIMEVNSRWTGDRGISLPFSDSCAPIASGKKVFNLLFDRLLDYARESNWGCIELRGGENFLGQVQPSIRFYNHILNLNQGEEKILNTFRSSTQRNIKKAVTAGVNIEISDSFDALKRFYRLNCLTRKDHGLPPQPFKFFHNLFDHIISKGLGVIALATINRETIAGAIFGNFGDTAIYKYGASDKNYLHLRPNNLVMWEMIRYYNHRKFKRFDFGRTGIENEGLNQYKNGWGTQKDVICYYRYDLKKGKFISEKQNFRHNSQKLLKKCPIFFLKCIGYFAYKHAA